MKFRIPLPKKDYVFLQIVEGKKGLETVVGEDIVQLHPAYKAQVIAFLQGVVKQLEKKDG